MLHYRFYELAQALTGHSMNTLSNPQQRVNIIDLGNGHLDALQASFHFLGLSNKITKKPSKTLKQIRVVDTFYACYVANYTDEADTLRQIVTQIGPGRLMVFTNNTTLNYEYELLNIGCAGVVLY